MRSPNKILSDHLKSITHGIGTYNPPDDTYPIITTLISIRTIAKERGQFSPYKLLKLGQVKILTTMIELDHLPKSENIISAATGMTLTPEGNLKASLQSSIFSNFVCFDDWWEKPHQAIDGMKLTRKEVVLSAQLDGIAHVENMKKLGVKKLVELNQSHFQYVLQYGYELINSPELLSLAKI